jgi:hypothetical protein
MIQRGKLVRAISTSEKYIEGFSSKEGFYFHADTNEEYESVFIKKTDLVGMVVDFWPADGKYISYNKILLSKKMYWFRTEDLEEYEQSHGEKNERHK